MLLPGAFSIGLLRIEQISENIDVAQPAFTREPGDTRMHHEYLTQTG
jgi:hypothetical protein